MRLRTFVCALAILVLPVVAGAQPAQNGVVAGVVRDAQGGVMPGVTVTVTSQERGFSRTVVTDENGRYNAPAVPIGQYTITAGLQGFKEARLTDNSVETEKTTSVDITLELGQLTDVVTVTGEVPIVDVTNATANTRVRSEAFEKLPVGRNYQSLIGVTPGVVGTGNVNALGALTANNLFLVDSVDTTDPTTGTFGTNLNFEAIQEVSVYTSGVSAEYGRALGAIVNVITKSGTNRFEGSVKYIFQNDQWNAQNTTKSQVTDASLARVKFDKVNPNYAFTGGGPIWKDHAWFFGAYEYSTATTARRQTVGQFPEDYQQSTVNKFLNVRGTVQLTPTQTAWVKYYRAPTTGFVIDYWGAAGDLAAMTSQAQSAENWAGQWSGVLRGNWTMEAAFADYASRIDVVPFKLSGQFANAPILNLADSKYYNGATFDGYVNRPRTQFNVASTWFVTLGKRSHSFKTGFDWQDVESGSLFQYPNKQLYLADAFDQRTRAIVPNSRRDYEAGASTSKGKNYAIYARDKFQATDRLFLEAGLRWEKQGGQSDLSADTVDAQTLSPRLSGTFDLSGDGKSLVIGSYGRFYAGIIQSFSDAFAGVPQQANYDNYVWNGTTYVLTNSIRVGGSTFKPNTSLKPYFMDEATIGYQRQVGRSMGAGIRFINRTWGDLIDDVRTFNPDGSIARSVVNYAGAERRYRGLQFTYDKRFANNWNAQASYTYSRSSGNHFDPTFSALGDYLDAQCRTTTDTSIGTGGVIPCREAQEGANKTGRPIYDRPHNLKFNGAYVRSIRKVNLTVGALAESISKRRYEKSRTLNVLRPGTLVNAGPTVTYFYEERGASQLPGMEWYVDTSFEATWRIQGHNQAGFKTEVFNLTNREEQIISNNTAWCGTTANATCTTSVANFGKATARGSFQTPRTVRFSAIYRF